MPGFYYNTASTLSGRQVILFIVYLLLFLIKNRGAARYIMQYIVLTQQCLHRERGLQLCSHVKRQPQPLYEF